MAPRKKTGSVRVNFKDVESFNTPPEGDYRIKVIDAKSGVSSNKNDQIELVFEIAGGEHKGAKQYLYCPLQENSLWKLHSVLTSLGIDVPKDDFDIDLPDLIDREMAGVLTHETYNGKKKAKLTDWGPLSDYPDLAEDDGKKSKKDKKKGKDEKPSKKSSKKEEPVEDKKADKKKPAKEEKSSKKDKVKKVSADDVNDMDEDELGALIKKAKLDVDIDGKKLKKARAAVIDALETADLLDD